MKKDRVLIVVATFCKLLLSDDVLNASIVDNGISNIKRMNSATNTGSISILLYMHF